MYSDTMYYQTDTGLLLNSDHYVPHTKVKVTDDDDEKKKTISFLGGKVCDILLLMPSH